MLFFWNILDSGVANLQHRVFISFLDVLLIFFREKCIVVAGMSTLPILWRPYLFCLPPHPFFNFFESPYPTSNPILRVFPTGGWGESLLLAKNLLILPYGKIRPSKLPLTKCLFAPLASKVNFSPPNNNFHVIIQ